MTCDVARLVEYVTQTVEPPVHGDEIEEIAMFARSGVGPFASGALAALRSGQADEQAALITGLASAFRSRHPRSRNRIRWRKKG